MEAETVQPLIEGPDGMLVEAPLEGEASPENAQPKLARFSRLREFLGMHAEPEIDHENEWISEPKPDKDLWDRPDAAFLEMVKCHAKIRITGIEPKTGSFTLRMKCKWAFRTLNSQEDAEIRLRGVPGIRMPGVIVHVEESRVWKDITRSSKNQYTVYWRGRSTFGITGFRIFDMLDFPFDRQALNLERLDFVWRPDKDAADHYKSMKVVWLKLETYSMLPDWEAVPASVKPRVRPKERPRLRKTASGSVDQPSYNTRFEVHLLIQRRHDYYIRQVFFTTYLITVVSISSLAMPLVADHMADRLSLYGGGLLTLLAFKYGIADQLPTVPYSTFTDNYLQLQLVVISLCCLETLFSFRAITYLPIIEQELWDWCENVLWLVISGGWTCYYLYAAHVMPRKRRPWNEVMQQQQFGEANNMAAELTGTARRRKSARHIPQNPEFESDDSNAEGLSSLGTKPYSRG